MKGKLITAKFPFYDVKAHKMSFKQRPALVLGAADRDDFVVLPVSTIQEQFRRDPIYDVGVTMKEFPRLNLKKDSFVRTNKQYTIHSGDVYKVLASFPAEYPEKYLEIISLVEQFQNKMLSEAVE